MATVETTMRLPPRWGDDALSAFVNDAFANCLATFVQKGEQYGLLLHADQCFLRIGENLVNPPDMVAAWLILRSHSAYRAACRLALSGQATDSFPSLRSCIEYALYALHVSRKPELGEVWLRRHDDDETKRLSNRSFQHVTVMESLREFDADLHAIIGGLYDRTIDFGGHPNERAVTGSMTMTEESGNTVMTQIYLHGDSLALDHVLKTTAQIGLGSLCIFQPIFKERFDLLGIRDVIDQLRRVL